MAESTSPSPSPSPSPSEEAPSLHQYFNRTQEQFLALEDSPLPSGHPDFQAKVTELLGAFLSVSKLVESESLFSPNETISDVNTSSIPLLMVPYYMAELHGKALDKRAVHLALANKLYRNFLSMCQTLGLSPAHKKPEEVMEQMEKDRSFRIEIKKKEIAAKKRQTGLIEKRKEAMRRRLIKEDDDDAAIQFDEDDETARAIHLTMLELALLKTYGELSSIKQEIEILRFAEKRKQAAEDGRKDPAPAPKADPGIQMYQIGEDGGVTHMGKAPNKFSTPAPAPHTHTHSASCSHSHEPADPNLVVQKYGPIGVASASVSASATKRQQLQAQVFRPGFSQPTESLQSYCDRMMPHAITGGGNEPTEEDLEREAGEKEDKEERDDEEYLAHERYWDEFKDDNPTGSGNRLRQG